MAAVELIEETPYRWRIEPRGGMRVPGIVFATQAILPELAEDQALRQVADVAHLPGIVEASYVMPDVHWGYGFPIGGVAATDVAAGGVISPGGVGFDISCGVRLLATGLPWASVEPRSGALMDALARAVPHGMGRGGIWTLDRADELSQVLAGGARYAVERGHGVARDLARCEDNGVLGAADPDRVSARARERGLHQVGSLGSGNHFLEVQVVDEVLEERSAEAFGLHAGCVCVMIHCGSRGLGHQVCTDHLHEMQRAMQRYGIEVPDRQLACAPVSSPEGEAYLRAMNAAANYGRANRQLIGEAVRSAFRSTLGEATLDLVYDVSHNMAKLERHEVGGDERLLCVHRKGATRALPPGHGELPEDLRPHGQPVMVPGSMGTASWVLAGVEGGGAFASTCHGAGRTMSRAQAKKKIRGDQLRNQLEASGIRIRAGSMRGLAEEAPFAYKDVDAVVATCEQAGLCRRVARLRPVGVLKG